MRPHPRFAFQPRLPRYAHRFTIALVVAALCSSTATAQGPQSKTNVLTTTIGGVFDFQPALPMLTQSNQTGNLCSPGACFSGSVSTKGNGGWQLQVKLANTPVGFYVNYVQTTVPASAQAVNSGTQSRLNATTWLTVATGNSATAGVLVGMMFNANKVNGNQGFIPTAAQLMPTIAYRVIAFP